MKRAIVSVAVVLFMVSSVIAAEAVVPTEKIMLWNGKDFAGWKLFLADRGADVTKTWSVLNGVLRCEGEPRDCPPAGISSGATGSSRPRAVP